MSANVVIRPVPVQQAVSVQLVPVGANGDQVCFDQNCPHLPESPGIKEIVFEVDNPRKQQSSVEVIIGAREDKYTENRQIHRIKINILLDD